MSEQFPIPGASVEAFVAKREVVAKLIDQVFSCLAEADSQLLSIGAAGGVFSLLGPGLMRVYGRETLLNDLTKSPDLLKKRMDAELWDVLFKASGMRTFMDSETRADFKRSRDSLAVVPLTEENLRATFRDLYANRDEMFANGVDHLFRRLSWDHKTNSPIAFGKRLILRVRGYMATRGIDPEQANIVDDLIRAMCVLSGRPEPDHRQGALKTLGGEMNNADRGEWHNDFFAVRWFKNGMAHFIFHDLEMVHKLNRVLASRYPMALAQM